MSAICGVVRLDKTPISEADMMPMMQALAHLGPDGSAIWTEGSCGLGHQMFCITSESLDEKLPFRDSEAGLTITTDARLDNRTDLLKTLDISTAEAPEPPDSSLIMKSYEKWGEDCVHHISGDFSFALWDAKNMKLIVATDHMGTLPIYYYLGSGSVVFATEIKGILASPDVQTRMDMEMVAMMAVPGLLLLNKYRTFFQDVHKLPAATFMIAENGSVHFTTYWTPQIPEPLKFKDEREFREAFQEIFACAVKSRLRSVFPVAALLSGGLDSSAITSMAAKILQASNKRLFTFSAVLPESYVGSGTDERAYIDLFHNVRSVDLNYVTNYELGPFNNLDRLIWGGEKPSFTSRHYQYTNFALAAREKGCRVILDGGGGELGPSFYGQGIMAEWLLKGNWPTLINELRKRKKIENSSFLGLIRREILLPLLPDVIVNRHSRFDTYQSFTSSPVQISFARQHVGQDLSERIYEFNQRFGVLPNHRENQLNAIKIVMGRWSRNNYVGYEGVRLLNPFFDRSLLEFCMAAPSQLKIHNGYRRYLIRAGMHGILPDKIRLRTSKEPFAPDFHDRYNRQKEEVQNILTCIGADDPVRRIVDIEKMKQMTAYHMNGNRCSSSQNFAAMHSVPAGIYLITFLKHFEKYWHFIQ